ERQGREGREERQGREGREDRQGRPERQGRRREQGPGAEQDRGARSGVMLPAPRRDARRAAVLAAVAVVSGAAGCGLGVVDSDSGGGAHLPTQGAGPYGKLPLNVNTP